MPAAKDAPRRPRRAITGRAIVLGTVIVLALVLLASPLSRYFASRGALSSSAQQLQQDKQALARLQQQIQRWGEPGYVEAQARQRLQYAMPGDRVFVVANQGERNEIDRTAGAHPAQTNSSWNTRLWSSVQHADAADQ